MEWLTNPENWIAVLFLTVMEVVLGIDNIIFITILAGKLPPEQQKKAIRVGLALAMFMRLGLLLFLNWIMGLNQTLFTIYKQEISGRDLILLGGGVFLLWKATREIHHKLEGQEGEAGAKVPPSFTAVIVQILILDMVFSLDSIITAVGVSSQIGVMMVAVIVAVGIMMTTARPIGNFVNRHPTVKMLALSFLLLIGMTLIVEGLDVHIPKGYIYFAMGFSVFVEMLNLRLSKKSTPVKLREPYVDGK